jgi:hypothetical protein
MSLIVVTGSIQVGALEVSSSIRHMYSVEREPHSGVIILEAATAVSKCLHL